jgi:hypothetical protein
MPEPSSACEAWQDHLAGWLVAQLGPEEEAALTAHLEGCARCRGEAESLLAVAAVSLGADPGVEPWRPLRDVPPPVDLADRIVARIATERRTRWRRRVALALVGAAAVVLLGLVLAPDGSAPLDGEAVTFVRLAPGVQADATVAPDAGGAVVELVASGLDPDVTYALWLTPPGGGYPDRVAAGTFRPDGHGDVEVRLRSALPAEDMGRVWATTPEGQIALDTEPA